MVRPGNDGGGARAENAQVSPGDVRLDAGELRRALDGIAAKYPGDDASQLGAAADWFVAAFKTAELPFNKAVTEGPLEKVGPARSADCALLSARQGGLDGRLGISGQRAPPGSATHPLFCFMLCVHAT